MLFEWDPDKAVVNLEKHGVGFEEAATVFDDPLADTFADPNHSEREKGFLTFGCRAEAGPLWFRVVTVSTAFVSFMLG